MTARRDRGPQAAETGAELDRLGREAFARGDAVAAEAYLRQAVSVEGDCAAYHCNLAKVLHATGRAAAALLPLQRALELAPDLAIARDSLGVVLTSLGRAHEALGHHRQAIASAPRFARGHTNLGICLERLGDRDGARRAYREALRLDKASVDAWCGLGRVRGGEPEESLAAFESALEIEPGALPALLGRAALLREVGRGVESLRVARRTARLYPNNINARVELAQSLSSVARDHEALRIYRGLRKMGVAGPALWFGMAGCYSNLGQAGRADRWYRKALDADPGNRGARSGYLFTLAASCLKSRRATLAQLRAWERHPGMPETPLRPRVRPMRRRRLRIGYLSPDFRQHVVRQFFEPVLWNHAPDAVDVYCYSEARRPDFATWTLRSGADRWFRTHGVSDRAVAERIHRDRVDVLVDLAGHTAHNRLGVMLWRPAPVQATYLGYFGSTGLSAVDYWIGDDVLHAADSDEPATETLWRLPRCAYSYGAPAQSPAVVERGAEGPVTFGCFNNVSKAGLPVVDAWAEILRRCPGAMLFLKDRRFAHGAARQTWLKRFERRGIGRERLRLEGGSPHPEYLAAYNAIDIALDPFPRTGGTTTCDALWMGVPVVTLAGRRYVTRLSATKLTAVSAAELITSSPAEYVEKAVSLAHDAAARRNYHQTLRRRVAGGPLGDPASLAGALEDAYREMLDRSLSR